MREISRQILSCNVFLLFLTWNLISMDTNATPSDLPKDSLSLTVWPLLIRSQHHQLKQVVAVDVQHQAPFSEKIEIHCKRKISLQDSVHQGKNHFEVQIPMVQPTGESKYQIMIGSASSVNREIVVHPG